ncbi:hypothetical protein [Cyclobacterium jeungdonense]|uniref:Uncharacterized protein n=1 Tax=Cyclobacterium jeungdonense TaxID=708087 RepID=A0ABT8C9B6_9BACT|nr:hypothetical protein [Cyclobacterium jeungdonense]MDN3688677.1 hypothetical protein [Cyclobacterium jeungdonense]
MAEDKNKGAAAAASDSEKELATMKEKVAALEAENKDLKAEIKKNESELKDAAEIVADLKEKVKAGNAGKVRTIKIDGSVYQVVGGFRKGDKTYKPEDIASDEKIAKELIKKQSGLIKKVK